MYDVAPCPAVTVEARGFNPAKSAPPQEGLQPRASTAVAPGSSCSTGFQPANLPSTPDDAPLAKGHRKLRTLAPILRRTPLRRRPHPQLHFFLVNAILD